MGKMMDKISSHRGSYTLDHPDFERQAADELDFRFQKRSPLSTNLQPNLNLREDQHSEIRSTPMINATNNVTATKPEPTDDVYDNEVSEAMY
ncbi:hypothetical protein ACOME3_003219 [Neoechinorhynchus agilis]